MATEGETAAPDSWAKRVGWFVLLWIAGVVVVGVVAYAIRLALLG